MSPLATPFATAFAACIASIVGPGLGVSGTTSITTTRGLRVWSAVQA